MSRSSFLLRPLGEEPNWVPASCRYIGEERLSMGRSVVHFEIIGHDPAKLRGYYGELFGWKFQLGDAVTEKVSPPGSYGFVDGSTTGEGDGINGGIGGGQGHESRVLFYVGVPDVESALQ